MSNAIQLSRLSSLVRNNLTENRQRYILYLVGMLFLGFIGYIIVMMNFRIHADYYIVDKGVITNPDDVTRWESIQQVLYFGGLFCFGGIFACISFVDFSNSAEAIFYMNKPASQIEKWLAEVVIRVFLFFLVYTLVYYVLNIPFTLLVRSREYDYYDLSVKDAKHIFHASKLFLLVNSKMPGIVYCLLVSVYVSIVGFFMYGAVLFNRFSFFKTLILGFVVGFVYFMYALLFLNSDMFMPEGWDYDFPVNASKYVQGEVNLIAEYPKWVPSFLAYFLMLLLPFTLYTCSYLKLKEKEV